MKSQKPKVSLSAADFLPLRRSYKSLCAAARHCRGCPLYAHATQTVFGEGPSPARLMLVGEQPGDVEDRLGRPFTGPSGLLLRGVLEEAGVSMSDVYVTNAVKHFKFEARGHRRIHKTPAPGEIAACRPWLLEEIALVRPYAVVCLGATAAHSLMGKDFKLLRQRGKWQDGPGSSRLIATYHPSAALRAATPEQREMIRRFMLNDLLAAAVYLKTVHGGEKKRRF
jgi:uracil-DNA glycosylase family protein